MNTSLNPGAASLSAVADELIGPFSGAVQPQELPWTQGTGFETAEITYRPLVLVRLLTDLEAETLEVTVEVDGAVEPVLTFAPWSERGSQVVACVPATDSQGAAAAFSGTIGVTRTTAGATAPLPDAEVVSSVAVDLVQGMLGRLTAVMLAEKARLRRQSRAIRAARALTHAHDSALDRIGQELSVPRLADRITWDAASGQVASTPLPGNREQDADYRPRLRLWRGARLPTPQWIDANVNGSTADGETGDGWMADLGFAPRVTIDEDQNPLFVTFRLVAPGNANGRKKLLDAIRHTHLVWSASSVVGDAAHAARMEPAQVRARVAQARASLKKLKLPAAQPVAPALAFALQRLDELQTSLGVKPYTNIVSGQRDDGGSRYELGLGAQLEAPQPADVTAAVDAAGSNPALALTAVDPMVDPIAGWLLTAAGRPANSAAPRRRERLRQLALRRRPRRRRGTDAGVRRSDQPHRPTGGRGRRYPRRPTSRRGRRADGAGSCRGRPRTLPGRDGGEFHGRRPRRCFREPGSASRDGRRGARHPAALHLDRSP